MVVMRNGGPKARADKLALGVAGYLYIALHLQRATASAWDDEIHAVISPFMEDLLELLRNRQVREFFRNCLWILPPANVRGEVA
jgi:hypothetical protein